MFDSLRTKLTLWYTGVLALVLIVFSAGIYYLLAGKLHRRFDAEIQTTIEGIERLLVFEMTDEGETETQSIQSALNEHYFPNQAAAIFDTQGHLLLEKALPNNHRAELPAGFSTSDTTIQFLTILQKSGGEDDGVRLAIKRLTVPQENKSYVIVVSQTLDSLSEELEILRDILLAAVPMALALAGLGGWFLARKSLAPVVTMSESARRIGAENLDVRLPVANPRDELGQLAATFNKLLERLQNSFTQQRQFMADASHELRTPLSVMSTAAEVTLEKPQRDESEYREALSMIDRQTDRLTRIVEDMFTLARADAGRRELRKHNFYLDELVAETAHAAAVLAERKGVAIECAPANETLYHGDEDLLRQMILNLLDNAIKFTSAGGKVHLQLLQNDSRHVIAVADTGTGISPQSQIHIFERFYRADQARSRPEQVGGSGAGLGLAIARWIAEAHQGSLTLQQSDHTGSIFAASLPVTR